MGYPCTSACHNAIALTLRVPRVLSQDERSAPWLSTARLVNFVSVIDIYSVTTYVCYGHVLNNLKARVVPVSAAVYCGRACLWFSLPFRHQKRAHASHLCVSCSVVVRPHVVHVSGSVISSLGVFWCLVLCFLEIWLGFFCVIGELKPKFQLPCSLRFWKLSNMHESRDSIGNSF